MKPKYIITPNNRTPGEYEIKMIVPIEQGGSEMFNKLVFRGTITECDSYMNLLNQGYIDPLNVKSQYL